MRLVSFVLGLFLAQNAYGDSSVLLPLSPDSFDAVAKPSSICLAPDAPRALETSSGRKSNTVSWQSGGMRPSGGYRVYHYAKTGKLSLVASLGPTETSYLDTGLQTQAMYCYAVTAWSDCDRSCDFQGGVDVEVRGSFVVCTRAR